LGDWIVLERQIHCQDKPMQTNPSSDYSGSSQRCLRSESLVVNGGKNCYAEVSVAIMIDCSNNIGAIFGNNFRRHTRINLEKIDDESDRPLEIGPIPRQIR
jgi:hypothetical protein